MCAPMAGHSEFDFFIIQPNRQPKTKTMIRSLTTREERPPWEIQKGTWASMKRTDEITFELQKLNLSLRRFSRNPRNRTSSQTGEEKTAIRMLSHCGARCP